jgi:iron complex outermembrane receptor protein
VPFVPFGLTKQAGLSSKITYDINEDWSLSYIAGHLNLTDQSDADVSGGVPGPGGTFISAFRIRTGFNNHQTSNELQLTGSGFDGKLDLTAGLYYFKETNTNFLVNTLFGGAVVNTSGADLVTNNYAAFGQITYHVTEQLGLTVGGRISEDQKKADFRLAAVRPVPSPTATVIREDDFKEFTPKFGVEYQATDDILVFASAAKGFKAGGYNGRGNTPLVINIPFNEEIVWTYEGGIKSEFADNRIRLNAGYFYNDFSDLQLQAFLNAPGVPPGTVVTSNSGTAKVDGIEV